MLRTSAVPPTWFLGILILTATTTAATLHVPADHPTIQACIDAAVSGQDECVVAPGTYVESINFNGKAITLRSSGGPDVTTIDGNGALHVVQCISGEGPDTVLEGFTITGGNASGGTHSFPDNVGGGMFNDGSSPTINSCIFSANTASTAGGGMYNFNQSNVAVTNCTFVENIANSNVNDNRGKGGGMYNRSSSPTLIGCMFNQNKARNGGAIYNHESNTVTIDSCVFLANQAHLVSGGAIYNDSSTSTVTSCLFRNNAAADGGAISSDGSSLLVVDATFVHNLAEFGGATFIMLSDVSMRNCRFIGNSAVNGGAVSHFGTASLTIVNSLLSGNAAEQYGGALFSDGAEPVVVNSSFMSNSAGVSGGAVANTGAASSTRRPRINNCVFRDDTPDEIWNDTPSADNPIIAFSNVQGGLPPGAIDGGGNIDADPQFVDPDGPDDIVGTEDDDLRLRVTSPCIDAGDNDAPGLTGILTDLAGNDRFFDVLGISDTGNGTPPVIDMGAYEVQCGNGLIEPGEICDDGAATASCDTDCTLPMCGDGLLNTAAGEECDDGNTLSGDGCRPNCTSEGSAIPTVSTWGLLILTLLLLTGARIAFRRRALT